MNKNQQTHEFALFFPQLEKHAKTVFLQDSNLVKRITSVLRLKEKDFMVLFTREFYVRVQLTKLDKKRVEGVVLEEIENTHYAPSISVLLPLLKREALETALYACVELGVTSIKLVITQKSLHASKDLERCNRIVIAAAEQSKNFAFPTVHAPCKLEDALSHLDAQVRLFADPTGSSLMPVIKAKGDSFALLVGPEGDLTQEEKEALKEHSFTFCHLTPTILRSPQAITVMVGAIRSLL